MVGPAGRGRSAGGEERCWCWWGCASGPEAERAGQPDSAVVHELLQLCLQSRKGSGRVGHPAVDRPGRPAALIEFELTCQAASATAAAVDADATAALEVRKQAGGFFNMGA